MKSRQTNVPAPINFEQRCNHYRLILACMLSGVSRDRPVIVGWSTALRGRSLMSTGAVSSYDCTFDDLELVHQSLRTLEPPHMHKFPRVNAQDSKLGSLNLAEPWPLEKVIEHFVWYYPKRLIHHWSVPETLHNKDAFRAVR
jgi:hypothetical protein